MGVVGNNYGMDSHRFSWNLVSQNLKSLIFLLFSQYCGGVQKNQWSPHFYNKFLYHTHKIRLAKLVPLNYRFPTDNKKSSNEIDQTVFKLDFLQKSGFPKIRDLSPVAPRGVYISRNDPQNKKSLEMSENINNRHFLTKWLLLLCICNVFVFPMGPVGPNNWIFVRRPCWPRVVVILSRPLSANTHMALRSQADTKYAAQKSVTKTGLCIQDEDAHARQRCPTPPFFVSQCAAKKKRWGRHREKPWNTWYVLVVSISMGRLNEKCVLTRSGECIGIDSQQFRWNRSSDKLAKEHSSVCPFFCKRSWPLHPPSPLYTK